MLFVLNQLGHESSNIGSRRRTASEDPRGGRFLLKVR